MWPSGFSCKGRAAAHLASREEVAAQSWLPSPYTPQDPQPGSLPWCGWREEEEGRKEGEQELPAVGLSLAMNSCLGAGHGAQGQSRGSNHPARAAEDGAGCDPELHKEGMLRKGISVFFLGLCFHVIIWSTLTEEMIFQILNFFGEQHNYLKKFFGGEKYTHTKCVRENL